MLVDITLRMLQPPELKKAQGFPDSYIIDRGLFVDPETGVAEWRSVNKTDGVRLARLKLAGVKPSAKNAVAETSALDLSRVG